MRLAKIVRAGGCIDISGLTRPQAERLRRAVAGGFFSNLWTLVMNEKRHGSSKTAVMACRFTSALFKFSSQDMATDLGTGHHGGSCAAYGISAE